MSEIYFVLLYGTKDTKPVPVDSTKMITREKIMETATQLFALHGVKSVTVEKIVKSLHTSKRTIYQHFPDKRSLVKASVVAYQEQLKTENEEIIKTAPNAIEAMGVLMQEILIRSLTINPNFYTDISNYHADLLKEITEESGDFAREELLMLGKWGIKDGIFIEDLDIEVVSTTVLHLLKLFKDNKRFPIAKFSKERLVFAIMVPYLRGLCTAKGLKILERQEELFSVYL